MRETLGLSNLPLGCRWPSLMSLYYFKEIIGLELQTQETIRKQFRITNNEMIFNCYQYTYNSLTFGTQFGQN